MIFDPEKLRAVRRQAGLSQLELASRANCVNTTISRAERGSLTPRPATMKKWADALGVEVRDLCTAAPGSTPTGTRDEESLLEIYRGLPGALQNDLLSFAAGMRRAELLAPRRMDLGEVVRPAERYADFDRFIEPETAEGDEPQTGKPAEPRKHRGTRPASNPRKAAG